MMRRFLPCAAVLVAVFSISETAFLSSEHREQKTPLIGQFEGIEFAKVWNDLKSNKVVSYTVARDLTQVMQNPIVFLHIFFVVCCSSTDVGLSASPTLERTSDQQN